MLDIDYNNDVHQGGHDMIKLNPILGFCSNYFVLCFLILTLTTGGCVSTVRRSSHFNETFSHAKTIAVLPADIKVYQLNAGGVQEMMDDWSDAAKKYTEDSLKKHLGERYQIDLKFIEKDWLKANHKELWNDQRALYEAVAVSASRHTYDPVHTFPDKVKNFDYTLGPDVQKLTEACGADALLFVYGFDYETTAGRKAVEFWNIMLGAAMGVTVIPHHPSFMNAALVDGTNGDVVWFNVNPANVEYSYRNQKHIDTLIEWLMRDFKEKEKK